MKAAYILETGPPEVIQYGEVETPTPGEQQALVRMTAVAVNPIDTYLRNGANYWELPKPYILGSDMAGVVEEVGQGVQSLKVGDRVWCTNQGFMGKQGTFAEYCCIDEQWLYPSASQVDDKDLAACALVGVTAHLGLVREAKVRPGETVFVNGGSGGVGSMVLQMAKALGAKVFATAGSPAKLDACLKLGADAVANYKTDKVSQKLEQFAPNGVDVYWETVREPDFETATGYLAERGRFVLMAGRDARPAFPVGPFYVKGCSLHGFVMFKATPEELRDCAVDINRWLSEGQLKANISQVFPLAQAGEAHRMQEDNTLHKKDTLAGKIVLVP